MGWGSAYSLFNTVADALIEASASDEVTRARPSTGRAPSPFPEGT